jgi:tyrosyl-tRNA synthetase
MESGEGMAISEFSYPLFQAYDWWSMYRNQGVQLQIGGSDQYGNIIAGMGAVSHMRKIYRMDNEGEGEEDPRLATYGLTTPLLTTASGEKFGKSAGNAVWLDDHMLNSFDLYQVGLLALFYSPTFNSLSQYFLRTADTDVERYLKLFTFLPLDSIALLMNRQNQDPSQRIAQHVLAREIVELAHGAAQAKQAGVAHRDAFGQGAHTFSLLTLRRAIADDKGESSEPRVPMKKREKDLLEYKKAYAASSTTQSSSNSPSEQPQHDKENIVTLPLSMLQPGSFPQVLHAAGLASSKSKASHLIANKGAYVIVPNSGSPENPTALKWATIESGKNVNPHHYLVDWEALVLRAGKTRIQVCRIVRDEVFDGETKADEQEKEEEEEEKKEEGQ